MPSYPMTPTPSRVPLKKPGLPPPMQTVQPGAMTSLGGQPTAPTPLQGPAPVGPSPTFNYAPPTLGAAPTPSPYGGFTGTAPTASPYGGFTGTAPTASPFAAFDPNSAHIDQAALNRRLDAGQKVRERSAANRGTLLTGGLQAALEREAQGIASDENQQAYNRALSSYGANRDTNQANFSNQMNAFQGSLAAYGANRDTAQQNFGNQMNTFQNSLAAYGANRDTNQQNFAQSLAGYQAGTGAQLDAGRLGLAGAQQTYGAQRDALGDARADAATQANVLNTNNQARDQFEQQMADYRAQVEAQRMADNARQNAPSTLGFAPRRRLPGQAGQGQ